MLKCPNCGCDIEPGDKFCPCCGEDLKKYGSPLSPCEAHIQNADSLAQTAKLPFVADKLITDNKPKAQNKPTKAEKKASAKNSHKAVIVLLSAFIAVAVAVIISVIALNYSYHNSDEYKLRVAEDAILEGDCSGGLKAIDCVNSTQANAVRRYVNLVSCYNNFARDYDSSSLINSSSDAYKSAVTFKDAVKSFEAQGLDGYLPERLGGKFALLSSAVSASDIFQSESLYPYLYDVQTEIYDYYLRKTGAAFTVGELKESYSTGKSAFDYIQEEFTGTQEYSELAAAEYCVAVKDLSSLLDESSYRISADQGSIENTAGKPDSTEYNYSKTDRDYKPVISDRLKSITSYDNIKENSQLLSCSLECGMLACFADGAFE